MGDERSQREKLEAMAHQTASPNEAKIAEHKLFQRYGHKHDPNALKLSSKGPWADAGPIGRDSHGHPFRPRNPDYDNPSHDEPGPSSIEHTIFKRWGGAPMKWKGPPPQPGTASPLWTRADWPHREKVS